MSFSHSLDAEAAIHLEAVDLGRNISRFYTIHHSLDLFGHMVIEYRWGRRHTKGQGRCVSFERPREGQRFVARLLGRRMSAPRRIGAGYERIV